MSHIHRTALLPYSDAKVFTLVNDVAAYPEYMDGCKAAIVHEQSATSMHASLQLERRGIQLEFSTRNIIDAPKSIILTLEDGPFEHFEGRWFFQHLADDACKVILDLQFSLNNRLLAMAAGKLFDNVANNMVDAMVQRARAVYG